MTRALVLGSLNADRVLRVPSLPVEGETSAARSVTVLPGGKGANQAVALARLGCEVQMAGAVGDDSDGRLLRAALQAEGIDTAGVRTVAGATGTAIVTVDDRGDNMIVIHAGANALVDPDGLPTEPVDLALLQLEIPVAVLEVALPRLRAGAGRVVLNAAPPVALGKEALGLVDVLIVNEHEAAALTGSSDPAVALPLLRESVRELAVITLGSRGGVLVGSSRASWAAAPVSEVVDTTGAGDCFVAAFSLALVRGLAPAQAARQAAEAAAIAVSRVGAQAGMPFSRDLGVVGPRLRC